MVLITSFSCQWNEVVSKTLGAEPWALQISVIFTLSTVAPWDLL